MPGDAGGRLARAFERMLVWHEQSPIFSLLAAQGRPPHFTAEKPFFY